ncbi:hypothetical protein XBJ1_1411 [Xenorhabdus bovienii SS-2004]|uniref:Uncharacterized protein n=1 Tax=Xenorhabdus bovienii (strain SS-2004) TaxID=406818 RepID=D3V0H0_XENBS|nr:hypothetical protein XBJ1_1411 [Xenorhabdus bovienii SS-2004]
MTNYTADGRFACTVHTKNIIDAAKITEPCWTHISRYGRIYLDFADHTFSLDFARKGFLAQ